MKIPGIKGCYEKTSGLFYFARMCSKIRLHDNGQLPMDYQEILGQGFDGRTCRYLSVRYEDVRAQVLSGKNNEEVLEWCTNSSGRRLTEEQVLIYNSFMSKRGWRDDETDEFIPDMIKQYGLRDDGSVITDFDLIEMDEGRWFPEMILKVNAYPGFSEHHTGRAVDIGSPNCAHFTEAFEQTREFIWLDKHASHFGFSLSYLRSNPSGIAFEPWHWCNH